MLAIDRHMKGTDQAGSLGPDGVNRMIRDIRIAEKWLGTEDLYIDKNVAVAKEKLERSIASKRLLKAGKIITEEDIHLLSPGDGFKWIQKELVIGHTVKEDIPANEIHLPEEYSLICYLSLFLLILMVFGQMEVCIMTLPILN